MSIRLLHNLATAVAINVRELLELLLEEVCLSRVEVILVLIIEGWTSIVAKVLTDLLVNFHFDFGFVWRIVWIDQHKLVFVCSVVILVV